MALWDKIKNAFKPAVDTPKPEVHTDTDFGKIITTSKNEYACTNQYFWGIKANTIPTYNKEIVNWPDKKKIQFILYCVQKIHAYNHNRIGWSSDDENYHENCIRTAFVQHLFRGKLQMDESDIEQLRKAFSEHKKWDGSSLQVWPLASMLNKVEKQYNGQELTPGIISSLNKLKDSIQKIDGNYYEKEKIKFTEKIDTILYRPENKGDVKPTEFLGADDFSLYANKSLNALPENEKQVWYKLIAKAQKATGSSPSKKYLEETKLLFKELGTDKFKKVVNDWFTFIINLKEKLEEHTHTYNNQTYTHYTNEFITPLNSEAIKGFVWMCSHFHDSNTVHIIANLADRSYRKIPNKGPAAAAIGNACLFTLYKSKGLDGIGQLSRLKLRIKQSSTQGIIEKYLLEAAKEQGVSIHEIEDMAVDDLGLKNGKKEIAFDDYKAEIKITGPGKSELNWFKPDGTEQKSVPAFIKEKHAAKLKKVKDLVKQVDQTSASQRDRIDRMFRSDRKWPMENFTTYYLGHGILSFLANKIIWVFTFDGKSTSAININNQWTTNDHEIIVPNPAGEVSLWHPAVQSISEIKKWRELLVAHQIQQPLKQAFREVYLLTEAEVSTKIYSNRMAAHVLKQHQFNMLAKTRGWKYSLLGCFDNGMDSGKAEVRLTEFGLKAEYWINELNADEAMNETGIWNYITTDQVRFIHLSNNEPADLVDIPAIPFSEILRDVDLFVVG